jgi:type IV pilus assembly protein PilA
MENPYARAAGSSAAPAPANGPLSPEAQKLVDYEAAIGPNRQYYLPKFEEFDERGTHASWNWPAFFVTSPWFIYRKMWLPGILNLAYPWVITIVCGLLAMAIKPPMLAAILWLVLLAAPSFVLAAYANSIYYRHVQNLIAGLPSSFAAQPDTRMLRLERNGGTGVGPMIGVLAGLFFVGIFMTGILAAIAIPAYQDYTIRSQVTEGLALASGVKAEVTEFYAKNHRWPEQADMTGGPVSGKYTASIEVYEGSVVITYGNQANAKLKDQRLALTPALDMSDNIRWICGNGKVSPGEHMAEGPKGTDLPQKYLPSMCRTAR